MKSLFLKIVVTSLLLQYSVAGLAFTSSSIFKVFKGTPISRVSLKLLQNFSKNEQIKFLIERGVQTGRISPMKSLSLLAKLSKVKGGENILYKCLVNPKCNVENLAVNIDKYAKSIHLYAPIFKSTGVLPDAEIVRLSKISKKTGGTKIVGKKLAKLKLDNAVLEDTYLRIAIHQGKLSREKAEKMYSQLSGVPGFRTTLRKVTGNNPAGTAGHLNELEIASNASKNGFKVLGIGQKFNDKIKKSETDIDVLLKNDKATYAIESKHYQSTTNIKLDKYRADLDSLISYKNKMNKEGENIIPVFTFTHKPSNPKVLKVLQHEAKKRGVILIFGSPNEQVKILRDI